MKLAMLAVKNSREHAPHSLAILKIEVRAMIGIGDEYKPSYRAKLRNLSAIAGILSRHPGSWGNASAPNTTSSTDIA